MMISVSMIVKNEESCLEKCLESVKEADEIVVCDTGSTDNTVEIARRYTDKVYTDYKWNDHFAEARNHALSKCTGEWVLTIDADEELVSGMDKLREAIGKTSKDALYFNTVSGNAKHRSIRLYKNNGKIQWKGRVHNYLNTTDAEQTDLTIKYGYSKAHELDPDRALRMLKKAVNETPDCKREKYYLAREYWYRKDYITAKYWYEQYLKVATWAPEMADAYLMLARCLWSLQRGQDARRACMQAVFINPDFKEALEFMSQMHYEPMKSAWNRYASTATNKNVLFVRQ